MTVAELIASREPDWRELEELANELQKPRFRRRTSPESVARFTSLYRAVCSDLALADSYQLPPTTVARLNGLVVKAHNCLYRQKRGRGGVSFRELVFLNAPRWILTDVMFWFALILFWGCYLGSGYMVKRDATFAADLLGQGRLNHVVDMYRVELEAPFSERAPALAGYVLNNGGIGLKTFAYGILGVFPGLYILLYNAIVLGVVSSYMSSPACPPEVALRFSEFTMAHGPFELMAIVLSAAGGMRMGFGLIMTKGYSRVESLRRATIKATPTIFVAFILFCLAAFIEAFISPNPMNWLNGSFLNALFVKRGVQWLSIAVLFCYFIVLGGLSIWRHYRSLSLRAAVKSFWLSATDVETERVEIDVSSAPIIAEESVQERSL